MTGVFPEIPCYRPSDEGATDCNTVQHWGFFSVEEVAQSGGALLMMDIDFGRQCSLRCPACFRKQNGADDDPYPDLGYEELLGVIDEAKGLGLQTVKICGAGEPLENPWLLPFARELTRRGIGLAVFTKGHVFGDDRLASRIHGRHGVRGAADLAEHLFGLETSLLVSFQSARAEVADRLVGGVVGYSRRRDRGLKLLAEVGFNKARPTRLAICANPIVRDNYDELLDIYDFGRRRNILPVNAALMVSGKQIDRAFLAEHDVTPEEKRRLFVSIYRYNLAHGFHTLDQLRAEGISCMPGIHPCNQIAVGLYLTCNGTVLRCPGHGGEPLGNVRDEGLAAIWQRHRTWAYAGRFNCHCPFKEAITLPTGLYDRVVSELSQSGEAERNSRRSPRSAVSEARASLAYRSGEA